MRRSPKCWTARYQDETQISAVKDVLCRLGGQPITTAQITDCVIAGGLKFATKSRRTSIAGCLTSLHTQGKVARFASTPLEWAIPDNLQDLA